MSPHDTQPAGPRELDPEMLAREGHGAIEVESGETGPPPPIVVLAGPIRHWWQPGQWDTPQHQEYVQWRDAVRVALVKAGCMVYSPHRAIQGSWNDAAQAINDAAISIAHVVVVLTPPGIPADGTAHEMGVATEIGVRLAPLPPGDIDALQRLVADLAQ